MRHASDVKAKPGRRIRSVDELFDSLRQETEQLHDLLHLVQSGRRSHVHGLTARLRALVCRSRSSKPLLQHCAGVHDVPLPVYVPAPHWAEYDGEIGRANPASRQYGLRVFPEAFSNALVRVDLDFWLVLPLTRDGQEISNNDMLRKFAETLGGAHHDASVEPVLDELGGISAGGSTEESGRDEIEREVLLCAVTVLKLCHDVLAAHSMQRGR